MRSLNRLIAAALLVAAPISCSPPGGSSGPSAGQGAAITVDSKAADLRVRLDLLLGEHVMVIAKESLAAVVGGRTDEYRAYATFLATNGEDLTSVMASAFGASAAARFDQVWKIGNGYLVDYTIGLVTHNAAKSNGAISGLRNGFVPQFAQFAASNTNLSIDRLTQLVSNRISAIKTFVDDQAAHNNNAMYADLHTAYAQGARIGDALASAIVQRFPDKFPGASSNKAVDFRVALDEVLQEDAYLETMATDATAGKRPSEQAAAVGALSASAAAVGAVFAPAFGSSVAIGLAQIWGSRDTELVVYCRSTDPANTEAALSNLRGTFVPRFATSVHDMTGADILGVAGVMGSQLEANIRVISDQKAGQFAGVAADDRTSAAEMQPIGDLVATKTVSSRPAQFV